VTTLNLNGGTHHHHNQGGIKMKGQARVLHYLKNNPRGLTQNEAKDLFGISKLSTPIHRLREHHIIDGEYQKSKNKFGESVKFKRYFYRGEINGE